MSATTHAQEHAARLQGQQQQQLPSDAVQLVFERLPLGEQVFTVSALSRAWRQRAQPKQRELREQSRQLEGWYPGQFRYSRAHPVPLWLGQKAWPALTKEQRVRWFFRAARHGDVRALRWMWLQQRKQPPCVLLDPRKGAWACAAAAAGGHLEALQLLRALRPPGDFSSDVCAAAAQGGHLTVLQWLRAQDPPCPWNAKEVCVFAARSGHLAVLQWLRAQEPPCPWDQSVCAAAAGSGRLAVLQWLRAQDPPCPWGASVSRRAAEFSHLAVLQWLRAQDPPCPWDKRECLLRTRRLLDADVAGIIHIYTTVDEALYDWIDQQPDD